MGPCKVLIKWFRPLKQYLDFWHLSIRLYNEYIYLNKMVKIRDTENKEKEQNKMNDPESFDHSL